MRVWSLPGTFICVASNLSAQRLLPYSAFNGKIKQWSLELVWKLRQAEVSQDILKDVYCCREGRWWLNWVQNTQNFMARAVSGAIVFFLPRGYLFFFLQVQSCLILQMWDLRRFFSKLQFFYMQSVKGITVKGRISHLQNGNLLQAPSRPWTFLCCPGFGHPCGLVICSTEKGNRCCKHTDTKTLDSE